MDLKDFIKQEQDRLKKLESELVERRAEEQRTAGAPAEATSQPQGTLPEQQPDRGQWQMAGAPSDGARNSQAIEADIKECKESIAASQHTLESSFAEKVQTLVSERAEAMLNAMGNATDYAQEKAMEGLKWAATKGMEKAVEQGIDAAARIAFPNEEVRYTVTEIAKATIENAGGIENVLVVGKVAIDQGIEQARELHDRATSFADRLVDGARELGNKAAEFADKVVDGAKELGNKAAEMTSKALDDAKVLPSAEEKAKVADLGDKQQQERDALEKNIGQLEKRFEEKFANNPNKEAMEQKFQEQIEAMRKALEDKQQKEIKIEINIIR